MMIDVQGYTAKQLASLIAKAEKQQAKLAVRPKAAAMRAKIDKYVRDHGYTIAELYGSRAGDEKVAKSRRPSAAKKAGKRKLGPVPPKYRNLKNPEETWSGRGRQPRWLAQQVAQGKSLEAFLIR
ncbi:H-NS histone family protein [Xanthomonas hortorum]|uniref:H-NS histone family protein n=1 Tax=Xanthomonas hortorum TaxID=56454 RepID=UPI0032E880F7